MEHLLIPAVINHKVEYGGGAQALDEAVSPAGLVIIVLTCVLFVGEHGGDRPERFELTVCLSRVELVEGDELLLPGVEYDEVCQGPHGLVVAYKVVLVFAHNDSCSRLLDTFVGIDIEIYSSQ